MDIKFKYSVSEQTPEGFTDLSINTNPLGIPKNVYSAIAESFKLCSFYPDEKCASLSKAIAEHFNVEQEQVLCAGGVDDAVYRIIYALKPKKAVIMVPTYEDYEKALITADCSVNHYKMKKENKFQATETIIDVLTDETDILFLCNPNNPTGHVMEPELMIKIVEHCKAKNIITVVDESFIEFLDEPEKYSLTSSINNYPNLLIINGFTKIYAMPGLRLGYCISNNQQLFNKIFLSGQPYNISIPSQAAGIAALEDEAYISATRDLIGIEKSWLIKELTKLGIEVWGSSANYLFFPSPVQGLREMLIDYKVLLRNCDNFIGLDSEYCRAAIKTHEENKHFIDILKKLI